MNVTNVTNEEIASFRKLRTPVRSGNVIIRKADKGRQFVIMNKTDYTAGVLKLLSDANNYAVVPFNGKHRAAALTRRAIDRCGGSLSRYLRKELLTFTNEPATRHFYALPKTHKHRDKWIDGIPPMRPICPDVRTESSVSGSFVASHLAPWVERLPTYIANSFSLVSELKKCKIIPNDAVMVTADIESLYPNIPTDDALRAVQELFAHECTNEMNADLKALIVELLRVQLDCNYFDFNGAHYLQIRGVPMGKPWAPAVACLYMGKWDAQLFSALQDKPLIFRRYIDDLFLVFATKQSAEKALAIMRTLNKDVKIGDWSIGKDVHFLDLKITLCHSYSPYDDQEHAPYFSCSVYRKDADLRVVLHFDSCHPWFLKTNVLLSQLIRFWRLCTDPLVAAEEINVFLHCMSTFRHVPHRTIRNALSRFVKWICRDLITQHTQHPFRASNKQACRRSICKLPFNLIEKPILVALRSIYERLTHSEQQYLGRPSVYNQQSRPLLKLLL